MSYLSQINEKVNEFYSKTGQKPEILYLSHQIYRAITREMPELLEVKVDGVRTTGITILGVRTLMVLEDKHIGVGV